MKHSKLPWKELHLVEDANKTKLLMMTANCCLGRYLVATINELKGFDNQANATFIVKACNEYEKNQKLLMAYAEAIDRIGYIEGCGAELLALQEELESIEAKE